MATKLWTRSCRECETKFDTGDFRKWFCSSACKVKWFNKSRPNTKEEDRNCVVCGKAFKPMQVRGPGRKWCSQKCRLTIARGYKPLRRQKEIERLKKRSEYMKRWVQEHGGYKSLDLKRKFGISLEEYASMFKSQGGLCAICNLESRVIDNRTGKPRLLAVDHCHRKDHVRKLLCQGCNQGLGCFKDDPALLRSAADYLELH